MMPMVPGAEPEEPTSYTPRLDVQERIAEIERDKAKAELDRTLTVNATIRAFTVTLRRFSMLLIGLAAGFVIAAGVGLVAYLALHDQGGDTHRALSQVRGVEASLTSQLAALQVRGYTSRGDTCILLDRINKSVDEAQRRPLPANCFDPNVVATVAPGDRYTAGP